MNSKLIRLHKIIYHNFELGYISLIRYHFLKCLPYHCCYYLIMNYYFWLFYFFLISAELRLSCASTNSRYTFSFSISSSSFFHVLVVLFFVRSFLFSNMLVLKYEPAAFLISNSVKNALDDLLSIPLLLYEL